MSIRIALVAAFAFAGLTAPTAFASELYTAKLATPLTEQKLRISANAVKWNCGGDTCLARGSERLKVAGCRQLAAKVGSKVTSYSTPSRTFSAEELEKCNAETEASAATPTEAASN